MRAQNSYETNVPNAKAWVEAGQEARVDVEVKKKTKRNRRPAAWSYGTLNRNSGWFHVGQRVLCW